MPRFTVDLRKKEGGREAVEASVASSSAPKSAARRSVPEKYEPAPLSASIIDLKKERAAQAQSAIGSRASISPDQAASSSDASDVESDAAEVVSETGVGDALLSWRAPEYRWTEKSPNWFLLPGGIALLFVLIGILAHNYFFVAFIALACAVVIMYGVRRPRDIAIAIRPDGIQAGAVFYRFGDLKSFWIFTGENGAELSVETHKKFTPRLAVPLGAMDPDRVRAVLKEFLSEVRQDELALDVIARRFGF
ncbi:MAG: hypothetical protein AAB539_01340 [Patescibacteria group bacterium]